MKSLFVALAALSTLLLAPTAFGATAGLAFDNVGISAGHGLDMTLPGGKLTASTAFGDGLVLSGNFIGAGGKNDATFYGARVNFAKQIPVLGGTLATGSYARIWCTGGLQLA